MKTNKKCKWFTIEELMPEELCKGANIDALWSLIDDNLKDVLDCIREIVGEPLICNTWHMGGNRRYSGYRPQNCSIGAAKSMHKEGKAADLLCYKYTAQQMRDIIKANTDKLPRPVRIEKNVSWLHIDVKDIDYKNEKIYWFV